jgi:hypothetical protein
MERGMLDAIDAWISAQPEPRPNRPEAVRRLVAEALGKARKARKAAAVKSPPPSPASPPPSAAFLRAQEIKELLGEKAP